MQPQQRTQLYFDHLVGAGEQHWQHFEAERASSAWVDKGHCKTASCFEVKRDNAHGVLGQI
jgi:hypothetical protein